MDEKSLIEIGIGALTAIVGGTITHLAAFKYYQMKLKSVFKKVNELERRLGDHEKDFLPKDDFHRSFDDLRGDIKDLRNQIHALVVGLSAR